MRIALAFVSFFGEAGLALGAWDPLGCFENLLADESERGLTGCVGLREHG